MGKSMRLRDKMTLWYTLLTVLTVSVFSAAIYLMTDHVLDEMLEQTLRLSLTQIAAQVEVENGHLSYENEVPLASSLYFIMEENGSELYSSGGDIALFDGLPVAPGVFQRVQGTSETWLVLDSDVQQVGRFAIRVRVAASCALNQRILATMRLIFLLALPLVALLAYFGGRMIAGRALAPIRRIIQSADEIRGGHLSARIPRGPARDEIGEMTDTLNGMLESLELTLNREKRFTSDASHELRTPVAVIRAYAENLLDDPAATAEQRASLTTLLNECSRMQKIIGQLLTITRGEEGRYPLLRETICLRELCEGVADTLADALRNKEITLRVDVPDTLSLCADQSLLTELLLNLCENAVKYGKPHGHILISAAQSDSTLSLSVADDGIGIPAQAQPHLFERFYRVDPARDRTGTGLGLSICEWIARAHGGTIGVQSSPGEGSTFTVSFPQ